MNSVWSLIYIEKVVLKVFCYFSRFSATFDPISATFCVSQLATLVPLKSLTSFFLFLKMAFKKSLLQLRITNNRLRYIKPRGLLHTKAIDNLNTELQFQGSYNNLDWPKLLSLDNTANIATNIIHRKGKGDIYILVMNN